jgi:hypothetical protein
MEASRALTTQKPHEAMRDIIARSEKRDPHVGDDRFLLNRTGHEASTLGIQGLGKGGDVAQRGGRSCCCFHCIELFESNSNLKIPLIIAHDSWAVITFQITSPTD